ncbi:MAG: hypothetical protein IPG51_17470 [Chloroflexi bacterium]|nr:hypothetical protein [Chloroflexota bacterium]
MPRRKHPHRPGRQPSLPRPKRPAPHLSLLPGQNWQVSFTLEPRVKDRFRLALTITYDDRNKRDKEIAFADLVQLILPMRDFSPIPNPYLPGTPLRHDSLVFFGRENLFTLIAENAGRVSQHNVLILIGRRRTGKTSFLLRLRQHLPENQLPVYIDCQSLGVIPGMPALLYELAWQIADALSTRGLEVTVPEPQHWQNDPTIHFQRRFYLRCRRCCRPEPFCCSFLTNLRRLRIWSTTAFCPLPFLPTCAI